MAQTEHYINFTVEDFINDEEFQNWVLGSSDKSADEFWNQFLEMNPGKKIIVEKAEEALKSIPFNELSEEDAPSEEKINNSYQRIRKILGLKGRDRKIPVISLSSGWWAAAASVIIILSLGYFFFQNENTPQIVQVAPTKVNDIAPGGNKAILTLGSGETIILDSAGIGTLSTQGGSSVLKLADGQIAYEESANSSNEIVFNTISTPAAGQYNLTLSDGSKVWLNAASSLRYPASFSGKDRIVELTGEGYFEVAPNQNKTFSVSVNNTVVEVLGTHFNINAYKDDNLLKTTLLEGSVKVVNGKQNVMIEPGQQAEINQVSSSIRIKKSVNLEEVVAWKNGLFQFDNTDIRDVMLQIGRWYDVDVVFEKGVPAKRFTGKIYRNLNASEVFKILEVLDIHFKIEGRKVIVTR